MPHLGAILRQTWNVTDKEIDDWFAIKAAADEAVESQLPGRENGPADAYRHLLWGAELTRKFGEDAARRILEGHEIQGAVSSMIGRDGQTPEAAAMDRHNNELAIALGNALVPGRRSSRAPRRCGQERPEQKRCQRWGRVVAQVGMVKPSQG